MAGEGEVAVPRVRVADLEQRAAAERDHLFGRGEAAVVAHDAAHQPGAEQRIGALEQHQCPRQIGEAQHLPCVLDAPAHRCAVWVIRLIREPMMCHMND